MLTELVSKHPKVLKEPTPQIALLELADSSVNWTIRPHVLNKDYREVYFELMEQLKETLDKHKINIPYPHQVIEIKKEG